VDPEALATLPFFSALSADARRAVAPYAERIEVSEGTQLTGQERQGYLFFVIERGRAAVLQDDRELRELAEGEFFGEIALLETKERTASVVARSPMRLIVVTEAAFKNLVANDPAAARECEAAVRERWAAPAT
jgi:CRP/FNR family transcriptional regulator, cyclic AMP receptor protein